MRFVLDRAPKQLALNLQGRIVDYPLLFWLLSLSAEAVYLDLSNRRPPEDTTSTAKAKRQLFAHSFYDVDSRK